MLRNRRRAWRSLTVLEPLEPRYFLSGSVLDDAAPTVVAGSPVLSAAITAPTAAAASDVTHLKQLSGIDDLKGYLLAYWAKHPPYRLFWTGSIEDRSYADNAAQPLVLSYSTTNTQVQGIDEADVVETDGKCLYIARGDGIAIVDAQSPEQARVLSRISIDGYDAHLYLNGTRLTVVTRGFVGADWYTGRRHAVVSVYDVADPANPTELSTTTFDGWVVASRAIGGRLYLVVSHEIRPWSGVLPAMLGSAPDPGSMEEQLPNYTTEFSDGTTDSGSLLDTGKLYAPEDGDGGAGLYSIVTIDTSAPQPKVIDKAALAGCVEQVYMAPEAIYLTGSSYAAGSLSSWGQGTGIQEFSVGADGVDYAASGYVPGRLLNSYSMDESDGYFRVATTSNGGWSGNGIFVLSQNGQTLDIVGSTTGLGAGERIYSARFIGHRAYLVTYRQTDPLFCIDLSDPTQPKMAGELEMPGYSTYLHPVGDHLLLAIGRAGNDAGSLVLDCVKLSLFDVSDAANPRLVNSYLFSDPGHFWTFSNATDDPHAFSYDATTGTLAIPVGAAGQACLELLKVDPETGLRGLGAVPQKGPAMRGLFIGSFIYSVGYSDISIVSSADPSQVLGEVELGPANYPTGWTPPIGRIILVEPIDPVIVIDPIIIMPPPIVDPVQPPEGAIRIPEPVESSPPFAEPAEPSRPATGGIANPQKILQIGSPNDFFAELSDVTASGMDDLLSMGSADLFASWNGDILTT